MYDFRGIPARGGGVHTDPRIESSPVRPKLVTTSFSCLQSALYTVWSLYLMFLQALLLYCFVLSTRCKNITPTL